MHRREFLFASLVASALGSAFSGSALAGLKNAHVIVVGGGFAGATAAKYIRKLSSYQIQVTLIEPNFQFVSCPMSNLVVGGIRSINEIATSYSGLVKHHGVRLVRGYVQSLDADARQIKLADGTSLAYDKLVLSPGIDLMLSQIEGLAQASANHTAIQAWKAGYETALLRDQIAQMRQGGVYAITIPKAPYRCPPGPYERACMVANYLKNHNPTAKVLVIDANDDVVSKGKLFKQAWQQNYAGMIEYLPRHNVTAVDATNKLIRFEFEEPIQADVLNVLPPMRGGKLAVDSGIANLNNRWAEVNYQTFESKVAKDIHVIGDTVQGAPKMPKSGHMANSQAKVAAAAIVSMLADQSPNPSPVTNNTCYSFVNSTDVVHVASVHQFDSAKATFLPVQGAGGLSPEPSSLEGRYAWGWAQTIWADTLA